MVSRNYEDDQRHPDGTTGKDVLPDTHTNADITHTTRLPGCGETVYVPGDGFLISHGGFSVKCKTRVYAEKVEEIRKKAGVKKQKRSLPDGGTYLSEDEILEYAAAIQAHRKMTANKGKKEQWFDRARERCHPGTDAVDGAKDGLHRHSDEFDIDKSRSTIFIGISSCGPPGVPLNGSKVYHHHYVNVSIAGPDGRQLVEVRLSLEQFASALVGNSHTPCTVSRYWNVTDDNVLLAERVRPPESIRKRMEKRLKTRLQEQHDKIGEIVAELVERADSGRAMPKTMLRDLAERLARAMDYSSANAAFTVQQAQEEITGIMESAALQFIGQQSLDNKTLWQAAGPALGMTEDGTPLLEDKGSSQATSE